jgi:hypothetical protein
MRWGAGLPLVLLCVAPLGGCLTSEQLAEQQRAKQAAVDKLRATDAYRDVACLSQGVERGSPGYTQCREDFVRAAMAIGH